MSDTLVSQILAAEQRAEEIRKASQGEAREMTKGAEEAIRAQERQAVLDLRTTLAGRTADAAAHIEQEADALLDLKQNESKALLDAARKKLGVASAFVYGRIVNNG